MKNCFFIKIFKQKHMNNFYTDIWRTVNCKIVSGNQDTSFSIVPLENVPEIWGQTIESIKEDIFPGRINEIVYADLIKIISNILFKYHFEILVKHEEGCKCIKCQFKIYI